MGCWLHPGVRVGMWRDTADGDGQWDPGSAVSTGLAKGQSGHWLKVLHADHPTTVRSPNFKLSTLLIGCLGTSLSPHGGAELSSQRII